MDSDTKKQGFVRKKNLQTMYEHVSREMYRRNMELAQTNKTLSILRKIDELALESQESLEIFANVLASAIAATGDYPFVSIITQPRTHNTTLQMYGMSTSTPLSDDDRALFSKIQIERSNEWLKNDE